MKIRLVDTSRNGLNQEPIHAPSEILSLYLQSRATLQAELRADGQVQVTFAVRAYEAWVLEESAESATGSVWREVHRVRGFNRSFLETWIPEPTGAARYYPLKQVTGW